MGEEDYNSRSREHNDNCEESQETESLLLRNSEESGPETITKDPSSSNAETTAGSSIRIGLVVVAFALMFCMPPLLGYYYDYQDQADRNDLSSPSWSRGNVSSSTPRPEGSEVDQVKLDSKANGASETQELSPSSNSTANVNQEADHTVSPEISNTTTPAPTTKITTTSEPSKAPPSPPNDATSMLDINNENLYNIHIPFDGDLHYRRVCAPVHSSLLCMTTRFPFEVPKQDPERNYPYPVDDRSYSLNHGKRFLTADELGRCQTDEQTKSLSIDERVKACLETVAATAAQDDTAHYSVWTRRRLDAASSEMDFYGLHQSLQQGKRIDKFFDKHVVLVLGASPAPPVTTCLFELFGGCRDGGIKPVSKLCTGHEGNIRVRLLNSYPKLDLNKTYIGINAFYPADLQHGRKHELPAGNFTDHLKSAGVARDPGFKALRKLSVIVEYPIAHAQNQDMIFEQYEKVQEIQKGFPKLFTDLRSEAGKLALAEMGYELGHIIAYDGIPQFNPSVTGAYSWVQKSRKSEEDFLANDGYPGWIPDYGSKCRGPLPPTNKLKKVNDLSRQSFEENGLDMNFYGRTWEFGNSFWWSTKGWTTNGKGLDCTHSGYSGISCVHPYLLMTMVDDHYDNLEKAGA